MIFQKKCNEIFVSLLLVFATIAIYSQVVNFDFVNYDDDDYIYKNSYVQKVLTLESIKWAFTTNHASNWHPLTWLSHMLDIQLYGMDSGKHHLTNLIFHIANTLLLFFLFKQMTGKLWQSSFVAALFALHPLHVESVAWLSERKDVLSTFFWMLTMLSYVRYTGKPGIITYLPVLFFFIIGLMAKPMLVTLPFVLLLLDYYPLRRLRFTDDKKIIIKKSSISHFSLLTSHFSLLSEKIPLLIFAAISSVITLLAQQSGGAVRSLYEQPLTYRITNAMISYVGYIEKMIIPHDLAIFYPPCIFSWWQIAGASLLLLAVSFFVIKRIKDYPYLFTGWFWYIGTLVPVIGFVKAGSQAMADRYTYIPLIGLFMMIAWGIPELIERWRIRKTIFNTVVTAYILILSVTAWMQVQYWKNSITLFSHALEVTENNILVQTNLGLALIEQGRTDEGIIHYLKALQLEPDNAKIHNNLGVALFQKGRIKEAIAHFQKALETNPNDADAKQNLKTVSAIQK